MGFYRRPWPNGHFHIIGSIVLGVKKNILWEVTDRDRNRLRSLHRLCSKLRTEVLVYSK